MAADSQTIVNDAVCIECGIPQGMQLPVLISLFAHLANVSADPQTLINGATCIECNVPPGMYLPVLISLAAQLVAGGGGGGAVTSIPSGAGAPVAAPTTFPFYIDTNTGALYQYYAGAWH